MHWGVCQKQRLCACPIADNTQQEKRYRSMQEHIRRAHPDYYIPKLPATEESFQLMITTPPTHRPQQPPALPPQRRSICTSNTKTLTRSLLSICTDSSDDPFAADLAGFGPQLPVEAQPPATANAAVALAQLHDWPSDFVSHYQSLVMFRTR